jgi:hypothetical protein
VYFIGRKEVATFCGMQYSKILGNMWSYIKQYIKLCMNMNVHCMSEYVSRGRYVHNLYYPSPGGEALTYIHKLEVKEGRRKEIGKKERGTQKYVEGSKNWAYQVTPRGRDPRRLNKEKEAEN